MSSEGKNSGVNCVDVDQKTLFGLLEIAHFIGLHSIRNSVTCDKHGTIKIAITIIMIIILTYYIVCVLTQAICNGD